MLASNLNVATPAAAAQCGITDITRISGAISASVYPFTNGQVYLGTFRSAAGRVDNMTPSGSVSRDAWHWLIVRTDSGNGWECLQGELDGTLHSIGTAAHDPITTNMDFRAIGENNANQHFDGEIDRIVVCNAHLSDAQLQSVMAGGNGVSTLIRYETNEGSGNTAVDASGNGNDGTLNSVTHEVFS